ncbi:DUF6802 family protein [Pseudonocardia spirodelae]|uniref:DUF6802 family protein n=1 Tax=Pseudonocardia spirodelae TaxID=3133431 RepID=A0ABU8TEF9_9PSEU
MRRGVPAGSTALAAAAAALPAPWWTRVGPGAPGPAGFVPVSGPAARDTDGDGIAETLLVDTVSGPALWTDTDGDGLADAVTGLVAGTG